MVVLKPTKKMTVAIYFPIFFWSSNKILRNIAIILINVNTLIAIYLYYGNFSAYRQSYIFGLYMSFYIYFHLSMELRWMTAHFNRPFFVSFKANTTKSPIKTNKTLIRFCITNWLLMLQKAIIYFQLTIIYMRVPTNNIVCIQYIHTF